jgi:hypothetical protein
MRTKLYSIALLLLSLVASGEVFSFIYLHHIVKGRRQPSYMRSAAAAEPVYLTERAPWGAWRAPNSAMRQASSCFSVALRSNSFGMRDREREVSGSPHRTVVLGDSFAEGWGVEEDQRFTSLLEARLGREFLNFGIEDDVGPLQYQIIYEQLASRFSHDQVLIMLLPDNDFTDDDADYWRRFRPDYFERYRPYYQADAREGYRPFYPVPRPGEAPAPGAVAANGWLSDAAAALRRNSWLLATLRYLRLRFLSRPPHYSGYVDFTDGQLRAVLWSLQKIKTLAGDRQVTVLVIPRPTDFARVAASGDNRLIRALDRFGRENDVKVVDLLPLMPRLEPRIERYYLPCDGHWSVLGNRIAADALLSRMPLDATGRPSEAPFLPASKATPVSGD